MLQVRIVNLLRFPPVWHTWQATTSAPSCPFRPWSIPWKREESKKCSVFQEYDVICIPPFFAPGLYYHHLPVPQYTILCVHCAPPLYPLLYLYPPYLPLHPTHHTPPPYPVPNPLYPLTAPLWRMPLRNICFHIASSVHAPWKVPVPGQRWVRCSGPCTS